MATAFQAASSPIMPSWPVQHGGPDGDRATIGQTVAISPSDGIAVDTIGVITGTLNGSPVVRYTTGPRAGVQSRVDADTLVALLLSKEVNS